MTDVEAEMRTAAEWFEAGRARGIAQLGAVIGALHASDEAPSPFCNECAYSWPCPTIRAVDGAMTTPNDGRCPSNYLPGPDDPGPYRCQLLDSHAGDHKSGAWRWWGGWHG